VIYLYFVAVREPRSCGVVKSNVHDVQCLLLQFALENNEFISLTMPHMQIM